MSKKKVNGKRKGEPDPPQRPSRQRDEEYFKTLTDWLAKNNGSFQGLSSEQIKWYRDNYPRYSATQSATGNKTVEVRPPSVTNGQDREFDKRFERVQRKIGAYLRSDTYRNSLPITDELLNDYSFDYFRTQQDSLRAQERRGEISWSEYFKKSRELDQAKGTDPEYAPLLDSLLRDENVNSRLDKLYKGFDLRLGSRYPEDVKDNAHAYWDPKKNLMSFDERHPNRGTLREELAHRSGLDQMYGRGESEPASKMLLDIDLTNRNIDDFNRRLHRLPKDGRGYAQYMANNAERRAKQFSTRLELARFGFDPNSQIPKAAQDSLKNNYDSLPENVQSYYDYYYKHDPNDINKYGMGGAIGRGIGSAANMVIPGLGTVLSPVLGMIGDSFDNKKANEDRFNKQFNSMVSNDNPYGYAFGGDPTDPPVKTVAAESTAVNISLEKFDKYQAKPIPKPEDYPHASPQQFDALLRGTHNYNNILIDSGLEGKYKLDDPKFDRQQDEGYLQQVNRISQDGFAYGGSIQKKYGIGGMLKGDMDLASYHGKSHANGGIKIDDTGKPSPVGTKEVEGKETRMNIGDQVYIFSDQLTIK